MTVSDSSPGAEGRAARSAVGVHDESGTESEDDSKRERMFGSIAIPGTAPGCGFFRSCPLIVLGWFSHAPLPFTAPVLAAIASAAESEKCSREGGGRRSSYPSEGRPPSKVSPSRHLHRPGAFAQTDIDRGESHTRSCEMFTHTRSPRLCAAQDLSRGPRRVGGGESPHARAVEARPQRLAQSFQDYLARPAHQALRGVSSTSRRARPS